MDLLAIAPRGQQSNSSEIDSKLLNEHAMKLFSSIQVSLNSIEKTLNDGIKIKSSIDSPKSNDSAIHQLIMKLGNIKDEPKASEPFSFSKLTTSFEKSFNSLVNKINTPTTATTKSKDKEKDDIEAKNYRTRSLDSLKSISDSLKKIQASTEMSEYEKDAALNRAKNEAIPSKAGGNITIINQGGSGEGGPGGSLLGNIAKFGIGAVLGLGKGILGYEATKVATAGRMAKNVIAGTKTGASVVGKISGVGTKVASALPTLTRAARATGSGIARAGSTVAGSVAKTAGLTTKYGKAGMAIGKGASRLMPVADVAMLGVGLYKGATMDEKAKQAEVERLAKANSTVTGTAWEATKTFFNPIQQGKNLALASREWMGLQKDVADIGLKKISEMSMSAKLRKKEIERLTELGATPIELNALETMNENERDPYIKKLKDKYKQRAKDIGLDTEKETKPAPKETPKITPTIKSELKADYENQKKEIEREKTNIKRLEAQKNSGKLSTMREDAADHKIGMSENIIKLHEYNLRRIEQGKKPVKQIQVKMGKVIDPETGLPEEDKVEATPVSKEVPVTKTPTVAKQLGPTLEAAGQASTQTNDKLDTLNKTLSTLVDVTKKKTLDVTTYMLSNRSYPSFGGSSLYTEPRLK